MPAVARRIRARPPRGGISKLRLLTRHALDRRTRASKQAEAIANGIAEDLGGVDQLSTVQRHLIEAFAGEAVKMHHLNAQLLLGKEIDLNDHSHAISNMVRIAQRIGVQRVARDVTPTVRAYAARAREQQEVQQ